MAQATRPTSSITQGLKPGEIAVVDGADKLKDGAKVLVRQPRATTATSAAPAAKSSASEGTQRQGGHRHTPPGNQGGG